MKDYNAYKAQTELNPEQAAIKEFRKTEYQRKFGHTAEERINQENPSPSGLFTVQLQALARKIVEQASALTDKKKKGDIENAEYAAKMAIVQRSVGELGGFSKAVKKAMTSYNAALKNGTLSYGMDQFNEGVLQGLNKGTVNLTIDDNGRALLHGKANNSLEGEFDVNIYDVPNVPKVVNKIKPINLLLDPVAQRLGLDKNGEPLMIVDRFGNKMFDSGPYEQHQKEVLKFSQNALQDLGPNGVRSYLADHMQYPQTQVKAMMEDTSFNDPNGIEWDNRGTAEAYASIDEYVGNKYNRIRKAHPETFAKFAKQRAEKIAAKKGVPKEQIDVAETTVVPGQGEEVSIAEDVQIENQPFKPLSPPRLVPPGTTEEAVAVEETPGGGIDVAELIKKYS
tara:strand:+ start:9793 stop:10977 length:1185 start_codon:yes stop_codon:yes gene_type:complete